MIMNKKIYIVIAIFAIVISLLNSCNPNGDVSGDKHGSSETKQEEKQSLQENKTALQTSIGDVIFDGLSTGLGELQTNENGDIVTPAIDLTDD